MTFSIGTIPLAVQTNVPAAKHLIGHAPPGKARLREIQLRAVSIKALPARNKPPPIRPAAAFATSHNAPIALDLVERIAINQWEPRYEA